MIWLIGVEFLTKAMGHLNNKRPNQFEKPIFYMKNNYEVKHFAANSLDLNRSVVGRYRNQLIKAITDEKLLPKLIVVIQDNDIIEAVRAEQKGSEVSEIYGRLIHWLSAEFDKLSKLIRTIYLTKRFRKIFLHFYGWLLHSTEISTTTIIEEN